MRSRVVAALLATSSALALIAPRADAGHRPEFDASLAARPAVASAKLPKLAAPSAASGLVQRASTDERYGVPSFAWVEPDAGLRARIGAARATGAPSADAAARAVLARLAPTYRLQSDDVSAAVLRYVHDTGRGGIIVSYTQRVNGVDVFRDEAKVLLDRNYQPLAIGGSVPSRGLAGARSFALPIERAVSLAAKDFGELALEPAPAHAVGTLEGGYTSFAAPPETQRLAAGLALTQPLRAKPVFFHEGDTLVPGYYVEMMSEQAAYAYVISASDGAILFRHDQMANDVYNYRVWANPTGLRLPLDGPQGNSPSPHPTGMPDNFNPPLTAPNLLALQNGPISTNDPWLPPGASVTTGNNVDAYADLVAPDGFSAGDFRASTTSANTFDRTYNTSLAPNSSTAQQMAAITQMFYDDNYFHDWYYDAGYNEAAGNMQTSNFGRGGLGGDPIHAEAQDYSGTNNANMSTPADGAPGRMQMYVFVAPVASSLVISAPPAIAGTYTVGTAQFGPTTFNVTAQVVQAIDGAAPTGDACSGLTNGAALAGKIAIVDRGTCTFKTKVLNAQNVGAIGVILVDNQITGTPPQMGDDATITTAITIPVLSVTNATGASIKAQLGTGVTANLQGATQLNRDGTIDNQIVAHEWGHSLSNRLIGNGSGLGNNQGGGMGEGWSDFNSMLMTVQPEDASAPANANFSGVYALAGYALSGNLQASNVYYFGIRRYPYSTDMTKNPLTFKHIQNGVALPVGPPLAFGADGSSNAEVHNTGEVWCTMLWECYAALLRDTGRLTFDQARDRMRDYLVAADKLTPDNPTITEARDAMLAAAFAGDIADYNLFWQAFAKRGCGVGAIAPDRSSTTNSPVTESFSVGGDVAVNSLSLTDDVASCDHDGYVDNGETGTLTIQLKNTGATTLSSLSASVTCSNPNVSFPTGNSATFAAVAPYATTSAQVHVKLTGASGLQTATFQVSYNDPGLLVAGPRNATLDATMNADEVPSTTESVEALTPPWSFQAGAGSPNAPFQRIETAPGNHAFFGPDPGSPSDQYLISPAIQVAASGEFGFTFQHAYSFEADATNKYDGGVIEISTNGGGTWVDIGAAAVPTYTGTIFTGSGNVLSGRSAYAGTSPGYPALQPVTVSLHTAYQGQTVLLRFRLASDANTGGPGWTIDNFALSGAVNAPFCAVVPQSGTCTPLAVSDDLPHALAFAIEGRNPAAGSMSFRMALPADAEVEVGIFDILGRRVATLANGAFAAGEHHVRWEPASAAGTARPGVYLARMTVGGQHFTQRFVLLN